MINIPQSLDFTWEQIGSVRPDKLSNTRNQLHHVVQFVAAAGKYLTQSIPDDSHTSMMWHKDLNSFSGIELNDADQLRVAIEPANLTLMILQYKKEIRDKMVLDGQTEDIVLIWLKEALARQGVNTSTLKLSMHYDIPDHAVADGQPYSLQPAEEFHALALYFANAAAVLETVQQKIADAGPVRCWPHHFDIATLIKLDNRRSGKDARTIGVGLSPGDTAYHEPYFYVSPWPYPDTNREFPGLKGKGKWHTTGWVGAVLPAVQFWQTENQREQITEFVLSALQGSELLLQK